MLDFAFDVVFILKFCDTLECPKHDYYLTFLNIVFYELPRAVGLYAEAVYRWLIEIVLCICELRALLGFRFFFNLFLVFCL